MSHVALYSPYIPKHAGGGEKYLLSIAEVASKHYATSILVPESLVEATTSALPSYAKNFGLDLARVHVQGSDIGSMRGVVQTMLASQKFSHLFAMTDGSIFPTLATHSYLIMQLPWMNKLSLAAKLKLNTWDRILVYSEFVRKILSNSWKTSKVEVLAPYVDIDLFVPAAKKEKIILNVGRFFAHAVSNSKRQDVIIDAFKRLYDKQVLRDYSLVLAGNVDPNQDSLVYLDALKKQAFGYPINFLTNLSFDQLREQYAKAQYYWHAAGFGVNQLEHPENTEHFGITTLEAMSSGCIPFVVPYGGQKEIVNDVMFFWETIDELYEHMFEFHEKTERERNEIAMSMRKRANHYSKQKFVDSIEHLLK